MAIAAPIQKVIAKIKFAQPLMLCSFFLLTRPPSSKERESNIDSETYANASYFESTNAKSHVQNHNKNCVAAKRDYNFTTAHCAAV